MTPWLVITTASAFGYAATLLPLLRTVGVKHAADISREPLLALTVQGGVLWLTGTTMTGALVSVAAGLLAMFIGMKIRSRSEQ